jgi:hypothetical protein
MGEIRRTVLIEGSRKHKMFSKGGVVWFKRGRRWMRS